MNPIFISDNINKLKSNTTKFWRDKITGNRRRDKRNFARLKYGGWKVLRIWGHDIKDNPNECLNRIKKLI